MGEYNEKLCDERHEDIRNTLIRLHKRIDWLLVFIISTLVGVVIELVKPLL